MTDDERSAPPYGPSEDAEPETLPPDRLTAGAVVPWAALLPAERAATLPEARPEAAATPRREDRTPPRALADPRGEAATAIDEAVAPESATEPLRSRDFGRVIAGRYRIVDRLAQGGIGAVYLAEHVSLRAPVAMKLLRPQSRDLPELAARFEREAIVGAHVKHPNIAAATDFGTLPDGSCYLVLELVEGTTLEKVLRGGRLPPARAADIALQIADALSALHERGVVHRDLKPSNVMLGERPGAGQTRDLVKVIDFGLARLDPDRLPTHRADPDAETERLTASGTVFGTVAYLAPEAGLGMEAVDERSDLYALGHILYRMLAGRHAFQERDEVALFRQQVEELPPPLAAAAPGADVPPGLEAIVRRLLEKDPRARFQSAAALREALGPFAGGGGAAPSAPDRSVAAADPRQRVVVEREERAGAPSTRAADDDLPRARPRARRPGAAAGETRRSSLRSGALGLTALAVAALLGALVWSSRGGREPREAADSPAASSSAGSSTRAPAEVSGGARSQQPLAASGAPRRTPDPASDRVTLERARFRDGIETRVWLRAYAAFRELARDQPELFATEAGRLDAVAVFGALAHASRPEAQEMANILSYELGSAGHDVLFTVLLLRGGSKGHALVTQQLREPTLRARLSPPLAVALRLYQLGCNVSTDIYAEAVARGDSRALLTLGSQRERCRKSDARDRAYRALERRLTAAERAAFAAPGAEGDDAGATP